MTKKVHWKEKNVQEDNGAPENHLQNSYKQRNSCVKFDCTLAGLPWENVLVRKSFLFLFILFNWIESVDVVFAKA